MKYLVNVEEILTRDVIIEAKDEADAEYKVERLYFDEKIILNDNDFTGEPTIKCKRICAETVECTEFD